MNFVMRQSMLRTLLLNHFSLWSRLRISGLPILSCFFNHLRNFSFFHIFADHPPSTTNGQVVCKKWKASKKINRTTRKIGKPKASVEGGILG
jgi:hypothetical protein